MTLKPLLLIPSLGLVCLLSACAGPIPKSDSSEARIDLQQQSNINLLADRIDGQRVNDGRYFEVAPGAHQLQMTLIHGTDGVSEPICMGHLDYGNFQAGERYTMSVSSEGQTAMVSLLDSQGKQVGQSARIRCVK